jgi:hypothetical protein
VQVVAVMHDQLVGCRYIIAKEDQHCIRVRDHNATRIGGKTAAYDPLRLLAIKDSTAHTACT